MEEIPFVMSVLSRKRVIGAYSFPTLAVTYYIFGQLFDLPKVEHVLGLLAIIQIIMITILTVRGWFRTKYDGWIEVEEDPGGMKTVNFVIPGDPEEVILSKEEVIFRIKKDRS